MNDRGGPLRAAPKTNRRPTRVLFLILLIVVALGSFLAFIKWQGADIDPTKVALPKMNDAPTSIVYLQGPGAPLVSFLDATAPLAAEDIAPADCRSLATTALPAHGEPPALLALAQRIPDPATAEMAVEHVDASAARVASCAVGKTGDRDRFTFARTVFLRRLRQIGAR